MCLPVEQLEKRFRKAPFEFNSAAKKVQHFVDTICVVKYSFFVVVFMTLGDFVVFMTLGTEGLMFTLSNRNTRIIFKRLSKIILGVFICSRYLMRGHPVTNTDYLCGV